MHSIWWGRLEGKLREARSKAAEYLITGGATSYAIGMPTGENYQRQVGLIQGLDEALALATEVDNAMLGVGVPNASGSSHQDD